MHVAAKSRQPFTKKESKCKLFGKSASSLGSSEGVLHFLFFNFCTYISQAKNVVRLLDVLLTYLHRYQRVVEYSPVEEMDSRMLQKV